MNKELVNWMENGEETCIGWWGIKSPGMEDMDEALLSTRWRFWESYNVPYAGDVISSKASFMDFSESV